MRIYVPCQDLEGWRERLTDPQRQWRVGYSARTLAHCWAQADGFPREVRDALDRTPALREAELLLAVPEHTVPLPGRGADSQTDLWALARTATALVSIAVEGKVREPFGPTVAEWLAQAADDGANRRTRLDGLRALLGLDAAAAVDALRYQLLHRTVSAVLEAQRFHARAAVLLVHSFSPEGIGFEDYAAFGRGLGAAVEKGRAVPAGARGGIDLFVAWVTGDARILSA